MRPSIFVGIPSYAERPKLRQTTDSIRATTRASHILEVHVEAQDLVKNKNKLLQKARESGAEFVCLCDDDVESTEGWDEGLIDGIRAIEKSTGLRVGQTSPLIYLPNGTIFCSWMNVDFQRYQQKQTVVPVGMHQPDSPIFHCVIEAGALPGTLVIFTRSVLDRLNWKFDTRYAKSQYEDVDQSLTCRKASFICLYNGTVSVTHHTDATAPRDSLLNRELLITKWKMRWDLSLCIQNSQTDVETAILRLRTTCNGARPKLQNQPSFLRRLRLTHHVYKAHGLQGVASHLLR
jgi:hypothetical protein